MLVPTGVAVTLWGNVKGKLSRCEFLGLGLGIFFNWQTWGMTFSRRGNSEQFQCRIQVVFFCMYYIHLYTVCVFIQMILVKYCTWTWREVDMKFGWRRALWSIYHVVSGVVTLLMDETLHQLIESLTQYLQGSIHPRWLAGFLASTESLEMSSGFSRFYF